MKATLKIGTFICLFFMLVLAGCDSTESDGDSDTSSSSGGDTSSSSGGDTSSSSGGDTSSSGGDTSSSGGDMGVTICAGSEDACSEAESHCGDAGLLQICQFIEEDNCIGHFEVDCAAEVGEGSMCVEVDETESGCTEVEQPHPCQAGCEGLFACTQMDDPDEPGTQLCPALPPEGEEVFVAGCLESTSCGVIGNLLGGGSAEECATAVDTVVGADPDFGGVCYGEEPACNNDGTVDEGEECDDGNTEEGDGCAADCTYESRIAFVTSSLHDGNLGGLAGADTICNDLATAAGLPGTYMAWLSTTETDGYPAARFVQSSVPYTLVDGTVIADDWADLTDGLLTNPLTMTETGGAMPTGTGCEAVLTGTDSQGNLYDRVVNGEQEGPYTCDDYTATTGDAMWGDPASTVDSQWSNGCSSTAGCDDTGSLYCFQQ